jgi:Phosphotransferase enzyme family
MSLSQLVPPVLTPALPLPLHGWGAEQALAALAEARDRVPLDSGTAAVVSALTTVVLRVGDQAVKVYPPGTDPAHLRRLSCALSGSPTAHVPVSDPVETSHGVVVAAPWLTDTRPVSWPDLGALLRAFHQDHAAADVPPWAPLSRLDSQVAGLPAEAAAVLRDARDTVLGALAEVRSELGEGTIHGDVSPSNVMWSPAGPRLIDLDWVGRAPREYDLSSASRRVANGEMSPETYDAFCAAYGFDVRSWAGLPLLDRIADLGGVAFRLWDSRHHGLDLDWVEDELRVWRTPL